MGTDLFDGCDDGEDLSKIEIDKDYAKCFEHNKRREALHRLQDLQNRGLAPSSNKSNESDSDEPDSDIADSPKRDLEFYDALLKIKRQDQILHQKDAKLFNSDSSDENDSENENDAKIKKGKEKKEKPLYLKDVTAKHLIEEGPEFGNEGDDNDEKNRTNAYSRMVYNKEQDDNVRAFLEAEKDALGSDDELILEKTKKKDEDEEDDTGGEVQKKLDEYFGENDKLDENEKFLKGFLLNKMWMYRDDDNNKEVIDDDIDLSEDEDELEKQDVFEAKHNFRHEEAGVMDGGDRIWGHSRVIEGSVRKKNSSRKTQRKSKEERMAQAERERREELKHLKNLKKKEIQEKLDKIRAIAGIGHDENIIIDENDLEEDFDPEEYDKKMKEVFNEGYYGAEDANPDFGSDNDEEIEKPDFDKEDELLGLPNGWDEFANEEEDGGAQDMKKKGKRKRKGEISLKEKVELDKELEEYYKLDYEDTIGDLKTRFKYKSVPANTYGLHTEEILMANDKDLNQYVSLKKLAPYREKEWKVMKHQKMKKKLILHGIPPENEKKNNKNTAEVDLDITGEGEKSGKEDLHGQEDKKLSRKKRRKLREAELKPDRSRMLAYGPSTKTKSSKKN